MQVRAIVLAQIGWREKLADVVTHVVVSIEQQQQPHIRLRIGIGIGQNPAAVVRIGHVAVFEQRVFANNFNAVIAVTVKVVVNRAVVRRPCDDRLRVFPCRVGYLVLRLFIVESTDSMRVKIDLELRQRMICALQQSEINAIRIDRKQSVQETGLIFDTLGSAMDKQKTRRIRSYLEMRHPVDRLVHRGERQELPQLPQRKY